MAQQDKRINEHGIDALDLHSGQWVVIRWNDAPDEVVLVVAIDQYKKTYKGERSMRVHTYHAERRTMLSRSVEHTQVVRIIGVIELPKL
jgi:hypothetical protein